jgi:hypothetical protein
MICYENINPYIKTQQRLHIPYADDIKTIYMARERYMYVIEHILSHILLKKKQERSKHVHPIHILVHDPSI